MTSKLAKSQIEEWWREGLKPTVDDIILINNLGLEVERGSDMFSFSACPRLAFLGDNILREPTVAKRLWIDEAQRLFANTLESRVYVLTYALGTPDDQLPSLSNKKEVEQGIVKFRDEVLLKYTETQILAAIDWTMNGNVPDLNLPEEDAKSIQEVMDVPGDHSIAKQLILQALAMKIPAECAQYALQSDLEKMVLVAAMHDGADILKNEHTKNAGKFYMAVGKIKTRLLEEKKKYSHEE